MKKNIIAGVLVILTIIAIILFILGVIYMGNNHGKVLLSVVVIGAVMIFIVGLFNLIKEEL